MKSTYPIISIRSLVNEQFCVILSALNSQKRKVVNFTGLFCAFCRFQNQACCNLSFADLVQLAASLWITSFDNKLANSLLTTYNRLVDKKLSEAMRTYPDIGLSNWMLQGIDRIVATCAFLAVEGKLINYNHLYHQNYRPRVIRSFFTS